MNQGSHGLLRTRRFAPLFWTQALGAFNDNFFKNALVILVAYRGASVWGVPPAQMVAVAGGIFILPFFLFSALAGTLADRSEKSRLTRQLKLLEIAIMAVAALGFLMGWHGFLFVVLFVMGLQSTFFGPIKFSILPQHLHPDELMRGNALIEAGTFLAILTGTLLGGNLIAIPGSGPALVAGGGVLFAALGYLTSRAIPEASPVAPSLALSWNPFPGTLEMIRLARVSRPVWVSILGISWFWLFGAVLLSLFPTWCESELRVSESVATLFLAIFSIGIALGSMLCGRLSGGTVGLRLVPWGALGMAVFTAWLSASPTPLLSDTATRPGISELMGATAGVGIAWKLFFLSVSGGLYIVPLYTWMQEQSAPAERSRIIAANNILNALFMVVGSAMLVGLRMLGFSTVEIFPLLAVLNGLIAILGHRGIR